MIADKIERLAQYEAFIPRAGDVARFLREADLTPAGFAPPEGITMLRKAYATKPDAARQFEVHEHTIDLMVCLRGEEIIHLCPPGELEQGAQLPGNADGCKLLGNPRGTAFLLRAGYFIAIFPREAHMVAGQVDGAPGALEKLVVKLPIQQAAQSCPCTSACERHGQCAACVRWHRSPRNSLPACLREKGKLLVDNAVRAARLNEQANG